MKKMYEKPKVEIIALNAEESIADEVSMGTGISPFALALVEDEEQG